MNKLTKPLLLLTKLLRVWGKFSLAVFLLAVTTLPARAGLVTVNKVDGVSFQYTAVDTNGTLVVTFTNPFNFVTQINNSLIPQVQATFAQLTLSPTLLTDDIPGLSGHFTPESEFNTVRDSVADPPRGAERRVRLQHQLWAGCRQWFDPDRFHRAGPRECHDIHAGHHHLRFQPVQEL